jgi:Tfp pilus assembly protein PilV
MKLLITCLIVIVSLPALAQNSQCDSITWKAERKLSWNDFRGEPVLSTAIAAKTHYNFSRTWNARGFTLTTSMVSYFSPCLSWSKNKNSENLLAHEQGHFDLAEYFRRLYYKRITEATYSPSTIQAVMRDVYRDVLKQSELMQQAYDNETMHSLKKEAQQQWLIKIADLLDSMRQYDKPEITVTLPKP